MKLARHLVVFVKAPRLGTVKTRLAADIGDVAAWQFYRRTTGSVLRRVADDPRWKCWLAVTPDRFVRGGRWWPARCRRVAQGDGDLGARMSRPMQHLPPGPVVIIGSDVPEISAAPIARAFAALGRHDAVFGPARDGGYWLVGLSRRRGVPDLFADVAWSSPRALEETLANLPRRYRYAMLEELSDVDDGRDYASWRAMRRAR